MYGLIDGSGFYASSEAIYNPKLRRRGIATLSNNDGNIIAINPLAKRLGIPKFEPYFKVKHLLEKHNIAVFSSNYSLYHELSERFMASVKQFVPILHKYSIDECFVETHGCQIGEYHEFALLIRRTVWKETRVAVSAGFGSTLTLAKAASHASKRGGYRGACAITCEAQRKEVLAKMDTSDVWGIGSQIKKRLANVGITNALALANAPIQMIRRDFSVDIERTVRELNNEPCLSFDGYRPKKKQIYSTRSLGKRITTATELKQAIAEHAERVAIKLRQQGSCAADMTVFASTSPYDKDVQYSRSYHHQFVPPTMDTRNISSAATQIANAIYKPGIRFYRTGIGITKIVDDSPYQSDLYIPNTDDPVLMKTLDTINTKYGKNTLQFGAKGFKRSFEMKRQMLSPSYLTRWEDIPIIKC